MAGPTDILDYASPRPQGRYRLPSVSRLEVQCEPDGLVVIETLRGKGRATFAMALGLLTLFTIPASVRSVVPNLQVLWRVLQHLTSDGFGFEIVLLGALWAAIAVIMLLVANSTWRKTVLEARDGILTLAFKSPFHQQVHRWQFEQILELGVDRTLEIQFVDPRLELLLRAHGGQLIHLFADHSEAELEHIAGALKETMGWGVKT